MMSRKCHVLLRHLLFLILTLIFFISIGPLAAKEVATPTYSYRVIKQYSHDHQAFTQGLIYQDGVLYESTGRYRQSSLRKVDLKTGKVLKIKKLPSQYFGEGLTLFQNKLIQLTWRSKVGFVYNKDTFDIIQQFEYPTEGWGITHNSTHLIMSDGTETLYFLDPQTFATIRQIEVHDEFGPINKINELEYIHGEIWANIWQTDRIIKISPQTGKVSGWINLEGLLNKSLSQNKAQLDNISWKRILNQVDVLNGIAYDSANNRLFITGKLWPFLYHIKIISSK